MKKQTFFVVVVVDPREVNSVCLKEYDREEWNAVTMEYN